MTDSAIDDITIDTNEWYSNPVDDIKSISGSGIFTGGTDGILFLDGTPVQYVSKKSGQWDYTSKNNVKSGELLQPDMNENLLLLIYKVCDRERIGEIYTKKTSIEKTDTSLQNSSFTGFIEISKDSISGDHFIFYNDGKRYCLTISNSGNKITGDDSFDRILKHVGIYYVYETEFEDVSLPNNTSNKSVKEPNKSETDTTDESYRENNEKVSPDGNQKQKKTTVKDSQEQKVTENDIEDIRAKLESIESKIDDIKGSQKELDDSTEESSNLADDILRDLNISIQDVGSSSLENDESSIRLVPYVTNRPDVTDEELEEYARLSDQFSAVEWIIKDLSLTVYNEDGPKLPGILSMVGDAEQVSLFDSLDGYEYDAVFYARDGSPRGGIDIYTTESQVTLDMIERSIDEIEVNSPEGELFSYIVISRTGYEPGVKSSLDKKKSDGGIIRGEDRDAIFTKDGKEFHICLLEQHNSDFFLYYPD